MTVLMRVPSEDSRDGASRASLGSRAASLCDKFDALERKWSLYNKFGDLEKKWSHFSAAARVTNRPRVIKLQELEEKFSQLSAFAKQELHAFNLQEKVLQRRKLAIQQDESKEFDAEEEAKESLEEERQDEPYHKKNFGKETIELRDESAVNNTAIGYPRLETRDFTPEDTTVLTATETSVLTSDFTSENTFEDVSKGPNTREAPQDEAQDEAQDEEPDPFVVEEEPERDRAVFSRSLKRRRTTKRSRRLLAKVRHWSLDASKSRYVIDPDASFAEEDDEEEEEVLFDKAGHESSYGEKALSNDYYEDASQRMLSSMPNHQLWQAYTNRSRAIEARFKSRGADQKGQEHEGNWEIGAKAKSVIFTSLFRRAASAQLGGKEQREKGNNMASQGSTVISCDTGIDHTEWEEDDHSEAWIEEELAWDFSNLTTEMTPWGARLCQESSVTPDVRDLLHGRLCNISATIIQSWFRRKLACRRVSTLRAIKHGNESRRRRDLLYKSATRIQSVRKFQINERYRIHAAIIQAAYRCWYHRKRYSRLRMATIRLQRECRMFLAEKRKSLAERKIQRCYWLDQKDEVASQISFDDSGISTLSFDNSYIYDDDVDILFPNAPYPKAISINSGNPLAMCTLPPLYPSSPLRSRANLRYRSSLHPETSPPQPQPPPLPPASVSAPSSSCLPPLPPSPVLRPRGPSPIRRGPSRAGLDVVKSRRRRGSPLKGRLPSPVPLTRQGDRPPLGKPSPRNSPLANIISTSSEVAANLELRKDQEKAKPAQISPKRHDRLQGIKGKLPFRHHHRHRNIEAKMTASSYQERTQLGTSKRTEAQFHSSSEPPFAESVEEYSASTCIQKIWRGHRSQIELASMLLTQSTVTCDYSDAAVTRSRLLRQKAQVMAISKAIAQVDGLGADERRSLSKNEVFNAEWKNILYINFALTNGHPVNTFATVHVRSHILRSKRIKALSREKVFKLTIKAALMQHLSEQQQKVYRGSLFARSLTRRRAPFARDAAIQIQRDTRRWIVLRKYTYMKECAISIQKTFRSWAIRQAYLHLRYRALRIQAFFRGELVRGIVFQYWSAAIALRQFWNRYRQARLREADRRVSSIQAVVRGIQARKEFMGRWSSAILIQTQFRSFSSCRRFKAAHVICRNLQILTRQRIARRRQDEQIAAVFIQRWWRFEQYNNMMRGLCATIIAAAFRCHRDSYYFQCMRGAALTIQMAQRRYAAKLCLCKKRQAAFEITSFFRHQMFRQRISRSLRAATLIASWYRGVAQQRSFEKLIRRAYLSNLCATQIQAHYRRFNAQLKYQQLLWSVAILQFQTRKMIEQKRQQEIKAAMFLQAVWRGWFEKSNYSYLKRCIVAAQSAYRRHIQDQRYLVMRGASIIIQAQFRSHRGRFNFHIHRGATIYLQRTWRQYRYIKAMKYAMSARIVNFARMVITRRRFQLWKNAAFRIQTSYRRAIARSAFLQQREACTKLQAFWRQLRTEAYYCLLRILVVRSQALFRRRIQQKAFADARNQIIRLQKLARWFCPRKRFLRMRKAALTLQEHTRCWLKWKNLKAIRIQAEVRRKRRQVWYQCARSSALHIQKQWRMFANRSRYLLYRKKAEVIQAFMRRYFKRMRELEEFSATRLQSWYRCHITRFKFVIYQFSIVLAQSAWRSYHQKRVYQHTRKSVQLLQGCFREKKLKKQRLLAKELIQRFLTGLVNRRRGLVLLSQKRKANKVELVRIKRKERMKYLQDREAAAIIIEYAYRKHRKQKLTDAAKVIQCGVRRRKIYLEQNQAALQIQCNWRQRLCERILFKRRKAGLLLVTTLQALFYGKVSRSKYCKVRRSMILIQSTLRAFHCRASYTRSCESLIVIQTKCRGFLCRSFYARLQAAISIQSALRGFLCRSSYKRLCERVDFLRERINHWNTIKTQSATILQRQWRRYSSQTSYAVLRYAVVVLQNQWRSSSAQRSYSSICRGLRALQGMARQQHKCRRAAAVLIQSHWRLEQAQCSYSKVKVGIPKLQHLIRVKQGQAQLIRAVTCFQSRWRMYRARNKYLQLRLRLKALQKLTWKVHWHTKTMQLATILQAHWRMHICKARYKKQREMIIRIQSQWRSRVSWSRFIKLQGASMRIQGLWRGKQCRLWYRKARAGLICLQRRIKGICHQRAVAAITLQQKWRMWSTRASYNRFLATMAMVQRRHDSLITKHRVTMAATMIQRQWKYFHHRHTIAAARIQKHWRQKRRIAAARRIQTTWRSFWSRREFKRKMAAAICIQSWFRSGIARFKLLIKVICATIVQSCYRSHRQRRLYASSRNSATLIAQTWRKKYSELQSRRASTLIQTFWRRNHAQQSYKTLHRGCLLFQQAVRVRHCIKLKLVLFIQKCWRMHSAQLEYGKLKRLLMITRRRKSTLRYSKWRSGRIAQQKSTKQKYKSALLIQQVWRKKRYLLRHRSATVLTSYARMILLKSEYEQMRLKAVILQVWWRLFFIKQKWANASSQIETVQAFCRMAICRLKFTRTRSAVVQVQSQFRGYSAMAIWQPRLLKRQGAAIILQSHWRAFTAKQAYQKCLKGIVSLQLRFKPLFLIKAKAATCLQSFVRQILSEFTFEEALIATVLLQSHARRYAAKLRYQKFRQGLFTMQLSWRKRSIRKVKLATCLQSINRMTTCKCKFNKMKAAAITIESCWRAFVARQSYQKCRRGMALFQTRWKPLFLIKVKAAVCIQNSARLFLREISYQEATISIVKLQSHVRRHAAQVQYQRYYHSLVTMQLYWKQLYLLKVKQATCFQSYVRMSKCKSRFSQMKTSAILVQCHWRRARDQQTYQQYLGCMCKLQAKWKPHFQLKASSATCIESYSRAAICQRKFWQKKSAAIILQSQWRRYTASKRFRSFLGVMASFQHKWKSHFLQQVRRCTVLQSYVRMFKCQSNLLQKRSAAVILQSRFRGHADHRRYQNFVSELSKVQVHWKRCCLLKVSSAICLQTHTRVLICQKSKSLHHWESAVIILQAQVRQHIAQAQWQRYRHTVVSIQIDWKRFYALKVKQAITLQSCLRMVFCKSRLKQMRAAAINVQCHWRAARGYQTYKKFLCGMISLQNTWKSYSLLKTIPPTQLQICARMLANKSKHSFHLMWIALRQRAAVMAQKQWRMWISFSRFQRLKKGFITLQAQFRMTCFSRRYKKCQVGFQRLHGLMRGRIARKLKASFVLQAAVRPFLVKAAIKRRVKSATLLSSWYRGRSCRNKYLLFHSIIVQIQRQFRQRHAVFAPAISCCFPVTQRPRLKVVLSALLMLPAFKPTMSPDATLESYDVACHPELMLPLNFSEASKGLDYQSELKHTADKVNTNSSSAEAARPPFSFACDTCDATSFNLQQFVDVLTTVESESDSEEQEMFKFYHGITLVHSLSKQWSEGAVAREEGDTVEAFVHSLQKSGTTKSEKRATPTAVLDLADQSGEVWGLIQQVAAVICFMKYGRHGLVEFVKHIHRVPFPCDPAGMSRQSIKRHIMAVATPNSAYEMVTPVQSFSGRLLKSSLGFFFFIMTLAAGLTWSPALFVSFLSISLSVLMVPTHCHTRQEAATTIQAYWRKYRAETVYLRAKIQCITLQRLARKWQKQRRYKRLRAATVKVQHHFRQHRSIGSQKCHLPSTKPKGGNSSMLRTRVGMGIQLCLVCRIAMAASRLVEAEHANESVLLDLCLFVIQIFGCYVIYSKVCKNRVALEQQQIRAITALQRAFRRRQALKRWKSNLGIQKQEVHFCTKLQRFKHLLKKLRAQENGNIHSDSDGYSPCNGSPVSRFPQIVGDFLEEENAAGRIQCAWRKAKVTKFHAAIKIQSRYRCYQKRNIFIKMRSAAVTIQHCLFCPVVLRRKKESLVNDAMKQLLVHRVHVLSAIVVQRWIRTIAAKKRFQKLNNRDPTSEEFESILHKAASRSGSLVSNRIGATTIEERDAAAYVSRWRRLQRDSSQRISATFDGIVTEVCEDHGWMGAKRRLPPLLADQLFLGSSFECQLESASSSNDSDDSNGTNDSEDAVATQNKTSKNHVFFQIQHVKDHIVKVTETETGVELAVETEDVPDDVQWCGFEVMPSCS